ncbi:hypothetical protein V6N11_076524 [Hibiscus sabdariffa]|uniref:DUF632 domain-containing protein n=1 Tax=Hibiscus sabdariffa TaxID=183260 RepID=A0ABR2Q6J1_9ROSI
MLLIGCILMWLAMSCIRFGDYLGSTDASCQSESIALAETINRLGMLKHGLCHLIRYWHWLAWENGFERLLIQSDNREAIKRNAEAIEIEREKRVVHLRKLEVKRADYMKTEKTKKEVEKLESQMMVALQAIETTSAEIIKLRELELYPQLIEVVKGQSTHQLELEVQQWHLSFCNLVKAQRDYIQSLSGWLRLSHFQFSKNPILRNSQESKIYAFYEEWHLAIDKILNKVASEGIKSFLTVIHAIVVQQAEEYKQKKKADSACKDFENKDAELISLESKYSPFSMPETNKDLVA